MNGRAQRIAAIVKPCAFVVIAVDAALVWVFRNHVLGGILLFTFAIPFADVGNYAHGVPMVDDERDVRGLMLTGMSEAEARERISRGKASARIVFPSLYAVLATAVATALLVYHGTPTSLLDLILARGSVLLLIVMIPFVLLPYVIIVLMVRRRKRV